MHTLNTASAILAIFIEALTGDVLPVTIFYSIQYMTFDFSIFRAETLSLDTRRLLQSLAMFPAHNYLPHMGHKLQSNSEHVS